MRSVWKQTIIKLHYIKSINPYILIVAVRFDEASSLADVEGADQPADLPLAVQQDGADGVGLSLGLSVVLWAVLNIVRHQ